MAKLYPPHLDGALPAFYKSYNLQTNELSGASITIPFGLNQAVSTVSIKGMWCRIRTLATNTFLIIKEMTSVDISTCTATLVLDKTEANLLNEGQYYKVQVAFVDAQGGEIGYYSTIGIIKCVAKPTAYIRGFETWKTNQFTTEFTGVYEQDTTFGDSTEKVYTYEFNIWDRDNNLLIASGVRAHDSTQDISSSSSHDVFLTYKSLPESTLAFIEYKVTTLNGLVVSSERYPIMKSMSVDPEYSMKLIAEANYEEGYIDLTFEGEILQNDNGYTETICSGTFVISRGSDKDDYVEWEEIHRFLLNSGAPSDYHFVDYTIEQGINYRYSLQQYNINNIYSNRILSQNRRSDNTLHDEPTYADFEDMFLYDGKRSLKIKFNPKVDSFKNTVQEQKIETIGGKYPFIFRNGNINYKEFQLGGLISYHTDEAMTFFKGTEERSSGFLTLEEQIRADIINEYTRYRSLQKSSDSTFDLYYKDENQIKERQKPILRSASNAYQNYHNSAIEQNYMWEETTFNLTDPLTGAFLRDKAGNIQKGINRVYKRKPVNFINDTSSTYSNKKAKIIDNNTILNKTYYTDENAYHLVDDKAEKEVVDGKDWGWTSISIPSGDENVYVNTLDGEKVYGTDMFSLTGEIIKNYNVKQDYDLDNKNIARERQFKLKVLDWLTDGNVKLFRSPTEGNYLVRLLNVNMKPKDELGRMLHEFSCNAYEIAEVNYDNLLLYNIVQTDVPNLYETHWCSIDGLPLFDSLTPITDSNGDKWYTMPTDQVLIKDFECFDFAPGDKIKVIYANDTLDNSVIITIGVTGSYSFKYDDRDIIEIQVLPVNTDYEDYGRTIIYSYEGLFMTSYDNFASTSSETQIAQQFVGPKENILDKFDLVDLVHNMSDEEVGFNILYQNLKNNNNIPYYLGDQEKIALDSIDVLNVRRRPLIPIYACNELSKIDNNVYGIKEDTEFALTPFGIGYVNEHIIVKETTDSSNPIQPITSFDDVSVDIMGNEIISFYSVSADIMNNEIISFQSVSAYDIQKLASLTDATGTFPEFYYYDDNTKKLKDGYIVFKIFVPEKQQDGTYIWVENNNQNNSYKYYDTYYGKWWDAGIEYDPTFSINTPADMYISKNDDIVQRKLRVQPMIYSIKTLHDEENNTNFRRLVAEPRASSLDWMQYGNTDNSYFKDDDSDNKIEWVNLADLILDMQDNISTNGYNEEIENKIDELLSVTGGDLRNLNNVDYLNWDITDQRLDLISVNEREQITLYNLGYLENLHLGSGVMAEVTYRVLVVDYMIEQLNAQLKQYKDAYKGIDENGNEIGAIAEFETILNRYMTKAPIVEVAAGKREELKVELERYKILLTQYNDAIEEIDNLRSGAFTRLKDYEEELYYDIQGMNFTDRHINARSKSAGLPKVYEALISGTYTNASGISSTPYWPSLDDLNHINIHSIKIEVDYGEGLNYYYIIADIEKDSTIIYTYQVSKDTIYEPSYILALLGDNPSIEPTDTFEIRTIDSLSSVGYFSNSNNDTSSVLTSEVLNDIKQNIYKIANDSEESIESSQCGDLIKVSKIYRAILDNAMRQMGRYIEILNILYNSDISNNQGKISYKDYKQYIRDQVLGTQLYPINSTADTATGKTGGQLKIMYDLLHYYSGLEEDISTFDILTLNDYQEVFYLPATQTGSANNGNISITADPKDYEWMGYTIMTEEEILEFLDADLLTSYNILFPEPVEENGEENNNQAEQTTQIITSLYNNNTNSDNAHGYFQGEIVDKYDEVIIAYNSYKTYEKSYEKINKEYSVYYQIPEDTNDDSLIKAREYWESIEQEKIKYQQEYDYWEMVYSAGTLVNSTTNNESITIPTTDLDPNDIDGLKQYAWDKMNRALKLIQDCDNILNSNDNQEAYSAYVNIVKQREELQTRLNEEKSSLLNKFSEYRSLVNTYLSTAIYLEEEDNQSISFLEFLTRYENVRLYLDTNTSPMTNNGMSEDIHTQIDNYNQCIQYLNDMTYPIITTMETKIKTLIDAYLKDVDTWENLKTYSLVYTSVDANNPGLIMQANNHISELERQIAELDPVADIPIPESFDEEEYLDNITKALARYLLTLGIVYVENLEGRYGLSQS